jgi:hypothetical protein
VKKERRMPATTASKLDAAVATVPATDPRVLRAIWKRWQPNGRIS